MVPDQEALAATVALAGQLMLGAVTSFKVTVNAQVAVLLPASVAVSVTVWAVLWPVKVVLAAGLWATLGVPQLSLVEAAE